jgi:hypothetical protein
VKRLAGGQVEFAADAGVGVHGVGPFGVGGKLDGEPPVGDGCNLRVALPALGGVYSWLMTASADSNCGIWIKGEGKHKIPVFWRIGVRNRSFR